MPATAYEHVLDALRSHGCQVEDRGGRAAASAPGHSSADRSVVVTAIAGGVLVHCHSDPTEEVLDQLGLTHKDLFDEPRGARYDYPDGRVVHRAPNKKFKQSGNTKGRDLFHVDQVADAQVVYYVEGEKDVLAVEAAGGTAVCNAQGAGKVHLADLGPLTGKTVIVVADKDAPGRAHARSVVDALDGIAEQAVIVEALVGKDVADHIAAGHELAELVPIEAASTLAVVRLADVEPERVSWLWPGRIPAGKLVTLDGDPSLGKSTLALTFAAAITTAGMWPDDTSVDQVGDVVLLSAEDGLADTVRPRLDAAGADVTRVHAVQGVTLSDGTLAPPTLADVHELTKLVKKVGARLLVVDVLMAYLPSGTDSHKDQDVRRVLSRLSAMADETGCTVLLLRHLNKSKGGDPMYRGGGSIGIVGAARAGMLVAEDPEDPTVRILASTKSNLGPPPESLRYRLASVDGTGVARVEWLGTDERNARQLLAAPADEDGSGGVDTWLRGYLADGDPAGVKATEVYSAADANGHSKDQAKRAKKRLGVDAAKAGPSAPWVWRLPSGTGSTPAAKGADTPQGAPLLPCRSETPDTAPLSLREQGASNRSLKAETAPSGVANTPGQTDRVEQALALAQSQASAPMCRHCGEPIDPRRAPDDCEAGFHTDRTPCGQAYRRSKSAAS